MISKLMFLSGVFGLVYLAMHTFFFENELGFDYPVRECVTSYLLFIIMCKSNEFHL